MIRAEADTSGLVVRLAAEGEKVARRVADMRADQPGSAVHAWRSARSLWPRFGLD